MLNPEHIHPDLDYTFSDERRVQRHLAPGTHACLFAHDLFDPFLLEAFWTAVLSCDDDNLYTGSVITPVRDFRQLAIGALVTFHLEQVAEVRGVTAVAA
ncbi:hypothetical protein [Deinococcus alpinitundrae]|uniref:hypothetical protein n=1 Tax=Deinococcus alpinitundrae TaxID=468913 RepID=UPI001ED8E649|nr:hypothetical protein [Deinococcus alpinitundrae]